MLPAPQNARFPAIGYTLRDENWLVVADESSVNAVEVVVEAGESRPKVQRYVGDATFSYLSLRTQRLTLGGRGATPQGDLDLLIELCQANQATAVSHQLTLPIDHVADICRQVDSLQERLGARPFFLGYTAGPDASACDPSLSDFQEVLASTQCGLTLDLTELYASALEHGRDAKSMIDEMLPQAGRVQLLLDGGCQQFEPWSFLRQSSEPVPTSVWELFRHAMSVGGERIEAVFISRDQNQPSEPAWRGELRTARRWAEMIMLSRAAAAQPELARC